MTTSDSYDWRAAVQDALLAHLRTIPAIDLPLVREYISEIVELERQRRAEGSARDDD